MSRRHARDSRGLVRAPLHVFVLTTLVLSGCGSDSLPPSCTDGPFTEGSCLRIQYCDDYALGTNGTEALARQDCSERGGTFDATRSCADFGFVIDMRNIVGDDTVCYRLLVRDVVEDAGTD